MIATHAGAVAGAWIYYLAIEVFGHDAEIEIVKVDFSILTIVDQLASRGLRPRGRRNSKGVHQRGEGTAFNVIVISEKLKK